MNSKVPLYQQYHERTAHYPGNSYRAQHADVLACVNRYGATSMLDYGCGKATQWTQHQYWRDWGFMPELYEPGIPEFSTLPVKKFDAIISTDVLEHIPETEIPGVLYWMFLHATKFIFLGIANTPARAVLPNGENAHCTVKSHEWWVRQIQECATHPVPVILKTYPATPRRSVIEPFSTVTNASK